MRESIDGLCAIIQEQFSMDPYANALYLFCGRRCDRIKAILTEPDGMVLIYKRLTVTQGRYRWPRDKSEVRNLTWREFDWLMSGIDIEFPQLIAEAEKGLWGGRFFEAIKDEVHLENCRSYIERHRPDNTKADDMRINHNPD